MLRPSLPRLLLACALLAAIPGACVGPPREGGERGFAPLVLPAEATLRPAEGSRGGAVALLVETERGVLLRLVGSRLDPGGYELLLGPDPGRGLELATLARLEVDASGRADLELELEGETLALGSRLVGRRVALAGPGGALLFGEIDKGVEVPEEPPPPPPPSPRRDSPAAGPRGS